LAAVATPESKLPSFGSVYALSKFDQERMSLMIGRAYRIPTVALRLLQRLRLSTIAQKAV
jgi:dTDP-L-rhamnose 4-epimerase